MHEDIPNANGKGRTGLPGLLVGLMLFLLGAWFLLGSKAVLIPDSHPLAAPIASLTTAPRRSILGDPPTIVLGGYKRTCMDCHLFFPARKESSRPLLQHTHICLNHGINDQCRNCHDTENRDRLVLHDGRSIPYARVVELCAKCHGPTYSDWERGMHGRTNGFWDSTRGERHRLLCTECHNPHDPRHPAMDSLRPMPGPRTLRMESPHSPAVAVEPAEADPLRKALNRSGKGGIER